MLYPGGISLRLCFSFPSIHTAVLKHSLDKQDSSNKAERREILLPFALLVLPSWSSRGWLLSVHIHKQVPWLICENCSHRWSRLNWVKSPGTCSRIGVKFLELQPSWIAWKYRWFRAFKRFESACLFSEPLYGQESSVVQLSMWMPCAGRRKPQGKRLGQTCTKLRQKHPPSCHILFLLEI